MGKNHLAWDEYRSGGYSIKRTRLRKSGNFLNAASGFTLSARQPSVQNTLHIAAFGTLLKEDTLWLVGRARVVSVTFRA